MELLGRHKHVKALIIGHSVAWIVSGFRCIGITLLPLRSTTNGARTIVWSIDGSLQFSHYSRGVLLSLPFERVYVQKYEVRSRTRRFEDEHESVEIENGSGSYQLQVGPVGEDEPMNLNDGDGT